MQWDADYVDFLGRSFEWQTWVYEQAVSAEVRISLTAVRVDHVDVENGASGGLVDAGRHNLW